MSNVTRIFFLCHVLEGCTALLAAIPAPAAR